jgi:hypothetical protein
MADYSKSFTQELYSQNSDYSEPEISKVYTSTYTSPTVCETKRITVATSGEAVIDASTYSSVRFFVLHNYDTTNYVGVTYTSKANVATTVRVPAGETLRLPDLKSGVDITLAANTDACVCEYVLVGIS